MNDQQMSSYKLQISRTEDDTFSVAASTDVPAEVVSLVRDMTLIREKLSAFRSPVRLSGHDEHQQTSGVTFKNIYFNDSTTQIFMQR